MPVDQQRGCPGANDCTDAAAARPFLQPTNDRDPGRGLPH